MVCQRLFVPPITQQAAGTADWGHSGVPALRCAGASVSPTPKSRGWRQPPTSPIRAEVHKAPWHPWGMWVLGRSPRCTLAEDVSGNPLPSELRAPLHPDVAFPSTALPAQQDAPQGAAFPGWACARRKAGMGVQRAAPAASFLPRSLSLSGLV